MNNSEAVERERVGFWRADGFGIARFWLTRPSQEVEPILLKVQTIRHVIQQNVDTTIQCTSLKIAYRKHRSVHPRPILTSSEWQTDQKYFAV